MSIDPINSLLRFARRWFDERTVTSVFEPLIADWQREWMDASRSERAWIAARGTIAFAATTLAMTPRLMFLTPSPPAMARRVLSRIIIFTGIVSVLLTIPIVMDLRETTPLETIIAAVFVLPSGIAMAFPFSMIWAADGVRRAASATPAERAAALRIGIIGIAFMVGAVGWGVPLMNQLYRELAAPESVRRPVSRSPREATLDELLSKHPPQILQGRNHAAARRERHNRAVVALLPAILLWLRFGAHAAPRKRWWLTPPVAVETALAILIFFSLYFSSVMVEPQLGLPPGSALWLPIAALLLAGALRRSMARRLLGERSPA